MGENLVAGILKNIEMKAETVIRINYDILTSVRTTNNILSKEIGGELRKQTKLLNSILEAVSGKKEVANKSFSLFGKSPLDGLIKAMSNKKFVKSMEATGKSFPLFVDNIIRLIDKVNEMDSTKFESLTTFIVDVFLESGKKILAFAAFTALAAPFLAIGLVTTLPALWLWMKFYFVVGTQSKKLKDGIVTLRELALTTLLVVGSMVLATFALGGPLEILKAIAITVLALGVIVGFYALLSTIDKPIKGGGKTMMWLALTTAIVLFTIIAASYMLGDPTKLLHASLLVAGIMLGLAVVFLIISLAKGPLQSGGKTMLMLALTTMLVVGFLVLITALGGGLEQIKETAMVIGIVMIGLALMYVVVGIFAPLIKEGAIAMIIGVVPIILLSVAMLIWKSANIEWEDIGMVSALVVGLGLAMAGAGLIAPFIAVGAGAMILVGVSLVLITKSLQTYKDSGWTSDDTVGLKTMLTDVVGVFVNLFSNLSFADFLQIGAGVALLAGIGMSIGQLAKGLSAFASGYAPIYGVNDKGEVVVTGTEPLGPDLGARVGETIKALITPLIEDGGVLAQLGAQSDSWWGQSNVSKGISLVGEIGNAIGSLAMGLTEFGKGYVVTEWEIDEKGKAKPKTITQLDANFATTVANTINTLISPLISETGVLAKLGAQGDSWWGDSDVAKGITLVGDIGNAIGKFAEGLINMADLKIPIYGQDANGKLTITGYRTWSDADSVKVGTTIKTLVNALTNPLKELGEKEDDLEDGIELLSDLSDPISKLVDAAKKLATDDIKPNKIKSALDGLLGPIMYYFDNDRLGKVNLTAANGLFTTVGDFANNLVKLGGDDAEKIGQMFTDINTSVNGLNLENLSKLNDLAYNLSMFAENMKGSFDDLTDVLEKIAEVVANMDSVDVNVNGGVGVPTLPAATTTNTPNAVTTQEPIDLSPVVQQLDSIYKQLQAGIEVEPKDGSFLAN